ncbi:DNA methyltransferase [Streptococcus uberis]|uniref:DNA methyltransferase n=1 Tax=Streptococcus uberis TaxID=1349 RepID=UPI0038B690C7
MDDSRKKQLLEILAHAQESVISGEEISTEFARVLFPPTRKEYELTYYGKESEQAIINQTFASPLQENRRFSNNEDSDWVNKIIFGENLQVLKTLIDMKHRGELKNSDGTDGIRLVYIDPPFATKQDFSNRDAKAYSDKLKGGEFLEWLRKRLILLKEVMSDDGSIYVHLDWHKAHYIKVLMDEIFGEGNFKNEIIWHYNKFAGKSTGFPLNHDTLYLYTKNSSPIFNKVRIPVDQKRQQTARVWDSKLKKAVQLRDENGNLVYYEQTDKAVDDTWLDIPLINPMAKERREINYPTQKPEKLLERVIRVSSNKGDLVLDCFGGSGTTASVAEKLERRWITIDAGKLAIYTMQKRILSIEDYKTFAVYDSGLYSNDKLNSFDSTQWKFFAMALYDVQPYEQIIRGFTFDGLKDGSLVKVYSHKELDNMGAKISEDTLEEIYLRLGNSAPDEIIIIAPKGKFTFAVDEYDNDGEWNTVFNILRVPYSMYQKFTENFTGTLQAVDSESVNAVIDAYGFDFMRKPKVGFKINENRLIIESFESFSRLKGQENISDFDAFSMLLIDFNYNGKDFKMDKVFYHNDFDENHSLEIPELRIDQQVMYIFIDKYGNEFKTTKGEII